MNSNIDPVLYNIPWDSIINLIGVVITVILSAYISNLVSKRSIESEIKKLSININWSQKR